MTDTYYNEFADYPAQWLENLIEAGHLPPGRVDRRSIHDVQAWELPDTCHFFAGIGGWPLALEMAGYDGPVWTGSCPCQPFSSAGQGKGFDDERHLWPVWLGLIRQCLPPIIFGEQVASKAGRAWLDVVSADLEALGYAVGSADLCAAGIGAPHQRQRLWFVAVRLADHDGDGCDRVLPDRVHEDGEPRCDTARRGEVDGARVPDRLRGGGQRQRDERDGALGELWSRAKWVRGQDGRARPIEPGLEPLADGLPPGVGRLRAYGNAIVPQLAAAFIEAALEVEW